MPENILNLLKGRMAEVLVERLFASSKYHVRNFGAPWKFMALQMLRGELPAHESRKEGFYIIPDEPDYVVYPRSVRNPPKEFIEVKFRRRGTLSLEYEDDRELIEQCLHWSKELPLSVVVVNCTQRPYFNVLRAPYINAVGDLIPFVPLMELGWNLDPETYAEYESVIEAGAFDGVCR